VKVVVLGKLIQVLGELLQRRGLLIALGLPSFFVLGRTLTGLGCLGRVALADAVGDEVHDVQTGHALLVEVIHGVRILFAEDGHQNVGSGDFLLAVAGRLHVHDGALDDALEAQGGLRVNLVGAGDLRRVVLDEVRQGLAQVVDVGRAGAQNLCGAGVIEQREQQVLNGDEFVPLLPGLNEGHMQADFKFLGNHGHVLWDGMIW
jgi:hypothetical protein